MIFYWIACTKSSAQLDQNRPEKGVNLIPFLQIHVESKWTIYPTRLSHVPLVLGVPQTQEDQDDIASVAPLHSKSLRVKDSHGTKPRTAGTPGLPDPRGPR